MKGLVADRWDALRSGLLLLPYSLVVLLLGAGCSSRSEDAQPYSQTPQLAPTNPAEVGNERSVAMKAWSAELVQRYHGRRDSDALIEDLELLEPTGKRRLLAANLIGPIFLFETERTIVSCEANGAMSGDHPLFIDLAGRQTGGPKHPGYLRSCARVEDSNLVFFHYNLVRAGTPYNLARIVNTKGALVLEKELSGAGDVEVRAGDKRYKVHVSDPELPG